MPLVGRQRERALLDRLLESREPEFLALYGRRRVGKTFLIREHFGKELVFELTGALGASLAEQLGNFQQAMKAAGAKDGPPPRSWQEAFQRLADHLGTLPGGRRRKVVVFLDELPWLAGRRAKFLPALDHFWNAFLSRHPRFLLVVCGSAASWMISKVVNARGGLHNRITARLRLEAFSLADIEAFLKNRRVKLTRHDCVTLAMAFGGIPYYLREAQPGWSAAQIIDEACFSNTGVLRDEFPRLFHSLFDHPDRHVDLVRALAARPRGVDRAALTATYPTGGRLTRTLQELSEAGFVSIVRPFGKKSKEAIHRLDDQYSLFYLRWIEKRRSAGPGTFLAMQQSPAWRAWSGYALESLAHRHVTRLKSALGIGAVETSHAAWQHRPDETWPHGAQIDLLLDRADNSINLFEIKFAQGPFTITKSYAAELRRKLETFRAVTGTRKNIFLSFLTTHGLTPNRYAAELAHQSLTTDCLFGS